MLCFEIDLSDKIKNAITTINDMVKRPNNLFNTDPNLGIHTLGFVPIDEIASLNDLGYGLLSWHALGVYCKCPPGCRG